MVEVTRDEKDRNRYHVLFNGKQLFLPSAITRVSSIHRSYIHYTINLNDPAYRECNKNYSRMYNKVNRKFHLLLGEDDNIHGYGISFKLAPNSIIRDKRGKVIRPSDYVEIKDVWMEIDKVRYEDIVVYGCGDSMSIKLTILRARIIDDIIEEPLEFWDEVW